MNKIFLNEFKQMLKVFKDKYIYEMSHHNKSVESKYILNALCGFKNIIEKYTKFLEVLYNIANVTFVIAILIF